MFPRVYSTCPPNRNETRQLQCISFFEKHNLLEEIATERFFADSILSSLFKSIVNIDFFYQEKYHAPLKILEIKFKNETRKNTFGMNNGQFQLYKQLKNDNIKINYWILYKKLFNGKEISIFDFLMQNQKKWWRFHEIDINVTENNLRIAPKETSIQGKKVQKYYEISSDEFRFVAPLDSKLLENLF